MPRASRVDIGGEVYHVINCTNGKLTIFNTKEDYQLFEKLLLEMKELTGMRILAHTKCKRMEAVPIFRGSRNISISSNYRETIR